MVNWLKLRRIAFHGKVTVKSRDVVSTYGSFCSLRLSKNLVCIWWLVSKWHRTHGLPSVLLCTCIQGTYIYIYTYIIIYIPVFIHLTAIPCTWLSVSWNHGVKGSREFVRCARQIRFPNLKSFDLGESSGPKGVFWVKIGSLKGGEHWPTRDPLHFRG